MKTFDIKPPHLTEPVINLRQGKPEILLPEKEDSFKKEFFYSLQEKIVPFKEENLFNEKNISSKKVVLLNKKIHPHTNPLIDESHTDFKKQGIGTGIKLKKLFPIHSFSFLKRFSMPLTYRPILRFSVILIVISLLFPLIGVIEKSFQAKEKVMARATIGYDYLLKAKEMTESADFRGAEDFFQKATESFSEASKISAESGSIIFSILKYSPFQNKVSSGIYLLEAGESISKAGEIILSGISPFLEEKPSSFFKDQGGSGSLTEEMKKSRGKIEEASKELEKTNKAVSKVKISSLPPEVQGRASELKEKVPELVENSRAILNYFDVFLNILGDREAKKYLLVFQNNREARATGGFIGSYGVIDVDRGRINKIFVDDIYNPDGQLFEKIVPPLPIQKIDNSWHMRDANWFTDFPVSARKISSFYEKTGGPTVDGIIAITPNLMEKLLEITGPIDMPEYGVIVDSKNFVEKTQYEVEIDYNKEENQPKKFLADLSEKVLNKVFSMPQSEWPKILNVFGTALKEKNILLYFRDEESENAILKYNFGGSVRETKGDFLMVVNSNIGGHKTDYLLENKIHQNIQIGEDGKITEELIIRRTHPGEKANTGDLNLPEEENWYKKANYNYLRVLVPLGAEIIEAKGFINEKDVPGYTDASNFDGFKTDKDLEALEKTLKESPEKNIFSGLEAGKTVFSGWVKTAPGETSIVSLRYKLPFEISSNGILDTAKTYSLLLEKQAGSKEQEYSATIEIFGQKEVKWQYGDGVKILDNKVFIKTLLNEDKFFGLVMSK